MIFETTVAPAALAPYNRADGPMLKALEKQFGPVRMINDKILNIAAMNYHLMLADCAPRDIKTLDFKIATQGIEGSEYYRGINRARSAGYPYCLETTKKGKTEWFGSDSWVFNDKTEELERIVNKQIAAMEKGQIQEYIFMDTLKEFEPLS